MNTDQIEVDWKQLMGTGKEQPGRLSDDDWKLIKGQRDQLVGKIQERYDIARDEAERQAAEFEGSQAPV